MLYINPQNRLLLNDTVTLIIQKRGTGQHCPGGWDSVKLDCQVFLRHDLNDIIFLVQGIIGCDTQE